MRSSYSLVWKFITTIGTSILLSVRVISFEILCNTIKFWLFLPHKPKIKERFFEIKIHEPSLKILKKTKIENPLHRVQCADGESKKNVSEKKTTVTI